LRILAIGDVIGRPGRRALQVLVPQLRGELGIDLAIANGENLAGGIGITPDTAQEVLDCGIDVITTGNHVWAHKQAVPLMESDAPVLRPLNFPPGVPGRGYLVKKDVVVVNVLGQTFIGNFNCPFRAMDQLLRDINAGPRAIIVDFHAEATSEKGAMGRYLDGRVSAVLGTHTHVGTVDAAVLPRGTAYVTDIGMTGPTDSVIGDEVEGVIDRFLTKMPHRITVGKGKVKFNAIVLELDRESGKALSIERIEREVE